MKQCAEWVINSQERYKTDLFFKTTVHIIGLQSILILFLLGAYLVALYDPASRIFALLSVMALSVGFGILLARFTLGPARDTLRYQKLFISNVAHELRTPLSIIKTSTEVALIDHTLSPDQRSVFLDIAAELDRVSEIINNLLSLNTLTRPERMQFNNVDLAPIVFGVVRRHEALAQERGIKIVVKRDRYTTVWGNASALEQIVTNLIKNAISFTPKGSRGTICATIQLEDQMVLLSISDTGVGISQEDLSHIFEPFYRVDMSRVRKVKKGGTGLGLTIVNEIVRVHHGKIQIQSTRRKGTRVGVYLPPGLGHAAPAHLDGKPGIHSEMLMDFSMHTPNMKH